MKKIISYVFFIVVITGCDLQEAIAINENLDERKVWVFAQINVPEEEKIEDYYYFGKVSRSLYNGIRANNFARGFILFEEVKYWGDNDIITDYADVRSSGELVFRIEDLRKIELLNTAPIAGRGSEQFDTPDSQAEDEEQIQ